MKDPLRGLHAGEAAGLMFLAGCAVGLVVIGVVIGLLIRAIVNAS